MNWSFEGTSGQQLFLNFLAASGSLQYTLTSPSGAINKSDSGAGAAELDRQLGLLTETGTHQLSIQSLNTPEMLYEFELLEALPAQVQNIVLDNLASSTALLNRPDHWVFSASAGQDVYIDFTFDTLPTTSDVDYVLIDPSGDTLLTESGRRASDLDSGLLSLSESGDYRLELSVDHSSDLNYQLQIWDVPAPRVRSLTIDQVETSTFLTPAAEEHWNFTADIGEVISVEFQTVDGGQIGYDVIAPDGSVVFSQLRSSNATTLGSGQIVLSQLGTYRIEMVSSLDDRPNYQFQVALGDTDLQVSNVIAPSTTFSGQQIDVDWTVTNVGSRATNSTGWLDSVYLSTDALLDASDTLLGSVANSSFLNGGESYASTASLQLPETISGDFYVIVVTDRLGDVQEIDDDNNALAANQTMTVELAPQPDLQVSEILAPLQGFSGQVINLSWTVSNLGGAAIESETWFDTVYLSSDTVLDASDLALENVRSQSATVNPGASYDVDVSVGLPIGISGDFYFIVETDSTDRILEFGLEGNNTGLRATPTNIILTPPPDLEVSQIAVPATALASHDLAIDYQVANFGATATPNFRWTDQFFLSQDTNLDVGVDFLLGSQVYESDEELDTGEFYDSTFTATVPDGLSGDWYVIVSTDVDDEVFEVDNANNIVLAASSIALESRPADLEVSDLDVPAVLTFGEGHLIGWTVTNTGIGDSAVSEWNDEVFLSGDAVLGNEDDVVVATVSHSQLLDAGDDYDVVDEFITVPDETLPGNYFFFVVTDATDLVFEDGSEANNQSAAIPVSVERNEANLIVSTVAAPAFASGGDSIEVTWNVRNDGVIATDANHWQDAVYLSASPSIDESAILLGLTQRTNPLDAGQQYTMSANFVLPIDLVGDYFVVVHTDSENDAYEGASEADNFGSTAATSSIAQGVVADLQVVDIVTPALIVSGRTVEVSWTVQNAGAGDAAGRPWVDSVFLSLNEQLDVGSDLRLGFAASPSDLAPAAQYTQTESFFVPAGLAGPFFAFVATDSNNSIPELANESNNTLASAVSVSLPQPVDLVVGSIVIPPSAVAGQQITVDYTVDNLSANAAVGTWVDSIYLSTNGQWDIDDPLLGRVTHDGEVAGGQSYSESLTAPLPGVIPGAYQVIVRSDILNRVVESDEGNNVGATLDSVNIDFLEIPLGSQQNESLDDSESVYYRVDVPAGETLLIDLESLDATATNELFVASNRIPTRADFDFAGINPFESEQRVVVPATTAGTYYVLVTGRDSASGTQSVTTSARLLNFEVLTTDFGLGGNAGELTIEVDGAKFDSTVTATLADGSGTERESKSTFVANSSKIYVTFDLAGLDPGFYDITFQNDQGDSDTVSSGLEVVAGGGGNIVPTVDAPTAVRRVSGYSFTLTWVNTGLNDAPAPVLDVGNTVAFGVAQGLILWVTVTSFWG